MAKRAMLTECLINLTKHQQKMTDLIGRTDPGFLSNASLCPNGNITMGGIKVFAGVLGKHAPMFVPFLEAVAALGWIESDTVVMTGGNGYIDAPEIVRTDEGLGLRISAQLTIPATLYVNQGSVTTYITRKEMPAEPTAVDYLMLAVAGIAGESKQANSVIGIGSNYQIESGNALLPPLVATLRWKLDTYFSGTADNTAHFANVQKSLTEVSQGQIPAALARPMVIGVKTKDVAPGLYHVKSISRYVSTKLTNYLGQIQFIAAWNDLAAIPDTNVTIASFLETWDGKKTNNVDTKACLGPAKAIDASFDLYEMTTQISGNSDRFLLVSPMMRQTDPDRKTGMSYPYVVTKGFALPLSETLPTMFGSAALLVGGIVMEANGNNCPIAPGHLRDPFAAAQPTGMPIMAPSMMPAAVPAAPVALPPVAVAASIPTMPPAIEVPSVEAFDLPFADELPGAATLPISAVAPMPAAVPAPPAFVAPAPPLAVAAPIAPVVPVPVAVPAPAAVMPLPVAIPAPPVAETAAPVMPVMPVAPVAPVEAVSSTVSKAPKARVTL
jgi:hypothetical protein